MDDGGDDNKFNRASSRRSCQSNKMVGVDVGGHEGEERSCSSWHEPDLIQ